MGTPQEQGAASTTQQGGTEIRIYHHSPIIYWWVVWAYGFVCAALTYVHGERLVIGEGKPGAITRRIQETFNKAVRGELPQYRRWLSFVRQEVRA